MRISIIFVLLSILFILSCPLIVTEPEQETTVTPEDSEYVWANSGWTPQYVVERQFTDLTAYHNTLLTEEVYSVTSSYARAWAIPTYPTSYSAKYVSYSQINGATIGYNTSSAVNYASVRYFIFSYKFKSTTSSNSVTMRAYSEGTQQAYITVTSPIKSTYTPVMIIIDKTDLQFTTLGTDGIIRTTALVDSGSSYSYLGTLGPDTWIVGLIKTPSGINSTALTIAPQNYDSGVVTKVVDCFFYAM